MFVRNVSLVCAAFLCGTPTLAQNFVGNAAFVDRAASGQITLGRIRGSIGVIDFDGDGWFDLFVADNPGLPQRLFHNVPSPSTPGGRTFVDVTATSGIGDADGTARSAGGVVVFDFDNDGRPDIYTLGNGTSDSGLLYHNRGDGTFENTTVAAGVRIAGAQQSCASAADFDHDGFVDLLVVNSGRPGNTLVLLRNNGNGMFTQRNDLLPPVSFSGTTYAQAWTDYDHDGWEDCMMLLNNGRPLMLKNVANPAGGRMFIDATTASGFTHVGPAPMGIALGDYNGDGWIDAAITDAVAGTYYENRAGTLVEVFPFRTFFGWGTTWIDAENDGRLDNYQAGSYGGSAIDFLHLHNADNTWTDARAALNTPALASQQCARVDFDNDGREDIITVNPNNFVSVYHNQSTGGNHWTKLRLRGAGATNRDAIGAVVRVTAGGVTQVRELIAGSSYSASEDPRLHFGLGATTTIDRIEIVWPRVGTIAQRTETINGPMGTDSILTYQPTGACLADLDANGTVGLEDLSTLVSRFGMGGPTASIADLDGDARVTLQDLAKLLADYGNACQ